MNNSELVSRIVNSARALNKDEHLSKRYVLSIARNKAKFLISQGLKDRALYKQDFLFRTIKCFTLKQDDIIKCDVIEFRRCKSLMKSSKKLPEMVYSRYGNSIISVTTIDGSKEFLPSSLKQFHLNSKRLYSKYVSGNYYYVDNGYLYLPDSTIESVNIILLAVDESEVEEVSECSDCDKCKSGWDYEFICPDKFLELVIQESLNEIMATWRKITPDENPNMSEHQRDRTVQ